MVLRFKGKNVYKNTVLKKKQLYINILQTTISGFQSLKWAEDLNLDNEFLCLILETQDKYASKVSSKLNSLYVHIY